MPRKVRVATTSFNLPGARTAEMNREQAVSYLEVAGSEHADLVCLPEVFLKAGVSGGDRPFVEPIEGPTFEALSQVARKHEMWVVAGYCVTTDDGAVENSAVVIDRQGRYAGRYGKVYPTIGECTRSGLRPGSEATVIETDFGRLGLSICFDIGYPEYWAELKRQGAEIVVWPSAYDGGFPLQCYAWMHSYHIVSSVRSDHGKVIDITGEVLASTSRWHRVETATIDLDKEVFHVAVCLGQHHKLFRLQEEMGSRVRIHGLSQENYMTIESNDPEWPLSRIKEHYGLLNFREYHDQSAVTQQIYRPEPIAWEDTERLKAVAPE